MEEEKISNNESEGEEFEDEEYDDEEDYMIEEDGLHVINSEDATITHCSF